MSTHNSFNLNFITSIPLKVLRLSWATLLMTMVLLTYSHANEEAPLPQGSKVLFMPFTVNIPGSYAYLENGLSSVLSSRLATRAKIQPIAGKSTGKQLANLLQRGQYSAFGKLLAKTNADYLIFGSLDRKDTLFTLTSYVFQKSSGRGPVQFEESLASINQAMDAVDNMSWQISGQIFNHPKPVKGKSTPAATDGVAAFHTAHPDRTYREGLLHNTMVGLGIGGQFELVSSHRSKRIHEDVKDINAVDIDGDGVTEILMLTDSQLQLYRFEKNTFHTIGSIPLDSHLRLHSVTFADMDNNGIQELYISGNSGNRPSSSIITWQGRKAKVIQDKIPYYLRAVSLPGQPPILYGQTGTPTLPSDGAIYELQRNSQGAFTRVKKVTLPKGVQVYDFTVADITGDKNKETILITPGNQLQVLNKDGSMMWTSSTQFGAGRNFFGTLSSNEERSITVPTYIKSRLVITDMDGDGINDVLVGRNQAEHVRFMPRLRYFDGGSIMALTWKTNMLTPLWETQKRPDYIINYQIAAAGKQSQKQKDFLLLFSEAETSYPFAFWQTNSATINSYRLRLKADDQNQQ